MTRLADNGVFVVGDDLIARWKPLELGSIVGNQIEVKSGISRGERIVTVGMRSLADGDKVIVAREGVCCNEGRIVFNSAASKSKSSSNTPSKTPETTESKEANK